MKEMLKIISNSKNYMDNCKKYKQNIVNIYKYSNNLLLKYHINYKFDGQIMGITDENIENPDNIDKIVSDILHEYKKYSFCAIYLDFICESSVGLVQKVDEMAHNENIKLYVPHEFAQVVSYATIVFDLAISGGDVPKILEYAKINYGANRVAAKISYNIMRFIIPSEDKNGEKLELLDLDKKDVFFSESLATNYYTNMINDTQCEFVMFDDENSFDKKMKILQNLDYKDIFISYDDIKKYKI